MSEQFHKQLEKQIKTLGLSPLNPPPNPQKWVEFIELINKTYKKSDQNLDNLNNSMAFTIALLGLEKKLEKQATHDPLTGLPNRALLSDHIQQAISIERRKHIPFGILFFDIDRFKIVNDTLGHQAGDQFLKAIAKRLRSSFRHEDTIARVGGDEFVMVALDLEKEGSITNVATKLMNLFKEPFKISGHPFFATISVGISLYPEDGKTPETLINHADIALYHAKDLGKNQYQFYSKKLSQLAASRLKKEIELRQAFEKKEFILHYQPQFNLATQKICGVEALLRWRHPSRGLLFPHEFIPLAEETRIVLPLGEWAIYEACKQNKLWQTQGFFPLPMGVNMVDLQLNQPNLIPMIQGILHETDLNPAYLEIEINENVLTSGSKIGKILSNLKKLGLNLALDDFGTGNSNLSYLKVLPISRIKIDKSFVHHIGLSKRDEVIIETVINMSHGLNYKVIAEGVETQQQIDFLRSNKCDEAQGHFFGKPMAAKEFEKFLKDISLS